MGADARLAPVARPVRPVPHVPRGSLVYGLGSVFGKTLLDSRLAILVVGGLLGILVVAGGVAMATTYGTLQARHDLDAMARAMPPAIRGFYGTPANVDTLGGFISWHYGAYFALLGGLWSILALSATLATEARRGSLDFAVATPRSRRSIAIEKVAAHVAALALVGAALALVAWATGAALGKFPGDEIDPAAAVALGAGVAVRSLIAGAIAFALAPLVGRGAAAGAAGAAMLGGYVVHGYRTAVDGFDAVAGLTWWSWTAGHIPLAGRTDWAAVGATAIVACALLVVGVDLFVRRDIGVTVRLPVPATPDLVLGLRGPISRSFGDVLPAAAWWSMGLVAYTFLMTAAASAILDLLAESQELTAMIRLLIPDVDITTPAGFLQFAFVDMGLLVVGLAAATFLAGRWADESERRLELQLATPLSRYRWVFGASAGAALGVAVATGVLMATIATWVGSSGADPASAATGVLALGMYGLAVVGIGIAAGGLLGATSAMPVALVFVVGTFLLDTLAPILRLPDWVAELALTTHLGEPLVGHWDPAGVAACLVLAFGGVAVGGWGMARRDVAG